MKKRLAGLVFALVAGFVLGWLIKPQKEGNPNHEEQTLNSSIEKKHDALNREAGFPENEVSNYIQKIEDLEKRLNELIPLQDNLEMQHRNNMLGIRRSHEAELKKIDSIVFLEPQQVESLKQVFQLSEEHSYIRSKKAMALITEEEADKLLADLPPFQHFLRALPDILNENQMVLYQEAQYLEQRKNQKSRATTTVERLTKNINIDGNQENQLIEQYLDIHLGPSSEYAKYIAPEFEDLQVADVVKAEISLASKVLTESQLIAYIENHLKRY